VSKIYERSGDSRTREGDKTSLKIFPPSGLTSRLTCANEISLYSSSNSARII